MGLDNIPVRPKADHDDEVPRGLTHKPGEPCPFHGIEQPIGMLGTCCWLRGKAAAKELEALGHAALSRRMHDDMTILEARAFAAELAAVADALEHAHTDIDEKPRGAGWNGEWNDETKQWDWQKYSTFEEAIDEIRIAARWYERVAELGFGVRAWW
jgi:hypothetical protein